MCRASEETRLDKGMRRIAYFTMESALESSMPTYSGGLGVLAGDTIRSAADISMPMVAVTLLHRRGYFTQGARHAQMQHNVATLVRVPPPCESAVQLGYDDDWRTGVPEDVVDRVVGVGNPFLVHPVRPGNRVLDLGCGAGFDVRVAAKLVGSDGIVVGLDLTRELVVLATRSVVTDETRSVVAFVEGDVEALPFADSSFDVVISNGVLNLMPNKRLAFREINRVLAVAGVFAAADLLRTDTVPPEVLSRPEAWSS